MPQLLLISILLLYQISPVVLSNEVSSSESCFCKLQGEIDDCFCHIETLDSFNNYKIYPLLDQLLHRNFFRYYKLNLFRPCPFESDTIGKCASKSCAVDECKDDQIPSGLKNNDSNHKKYSKEANTKDKKAHCEEENNPLGDIDPHLSEESMEAFEVWQKHDDKQENFCEPEDEDAPEAVYYDLIRNPERFTGYTGPSAVNVWKLIYDQNCFKADAMDKKSYLTQHAGNGIEGLCLEKRVFFRMISGFHTSINVDVTANWLIPGKTAWDPPGWGPNLDEFVKRFDPALTYGEGPKRLKNLYFTYLVELRALAKVAPYLEKEFFYTGDEQDDKEVSTLIRKLLTSIKEFPDHFDESLLFKGDAKKLKEDFKRHFRNISHIMDCVGCDKCRLWGKLQITGMGTALKILFSGDSMQPDSTVTQDHRRAEIPFQLTRGEIVALLNGFGRLSKSIHEVDNFRKMMT